MPIIVAEYLSPRLMIVFYALVGSVCMHMCQLRFCAYLQQGVSCVTLWTHISSMNIIITVRLSSS